MENTSKSLETIFVSIASYRDPECQWTVKDLFSKAKHPERIFVGICWQCDKEEDKDCFLIETTRPTQVRTKFLHWKDARGPCLARYIAQSLWQGEQYYLQIDSHMRFVKYWDEKLIKLLEKCPNPKMTILTTYPVGYELNNPMPTETKPPLLVVEEFGPEGMLRLKGKLLNKCFDEPIKSLFWVSGFAFSYSNVIQEVPYDNNLPFLFFGEETLMNVRLWTHGYDFYAPGRSIIYHLWDRSYRPTFRQVTIEGREEQEKGALLRVKYILGIVDDIDERYKVELDKFGLGTVRSLDNYQEFSGINLTTKTIENKAKLGGYNKEIFMDYLLEMIMNMKTT